MVYSIEAKFYEAKNGIPMIPGKPVVHQSIWLNNPM